MKSDLANKIVNGKTAPSPIPWQVHLRQGSPTGIFWYFCGGTIIDAKTILTAAHCYHGKNLNAADFFITVGVVHVQDGAGQSVFVEKITLHESYNPSTINNDIAILKLKTPLTFNNNVQPACLPEASFVPIGRAVASGWGLVSQFPDQSPNNLQVCLFSRERGPGWGQGVTLRLDSSGLTLVLSRYQCHMSPDTTQLLKFTYFSLPTMLIEYHILLFFKYFQLFFIAFFYCDCFNNAFY